MFTLIIIIIIIEVGEWRWLARPLCARSALRAVLAPLSLSLSLPASSPSINSIYLVSSSSNWPTTSPDCTVRFSDFILTQRERERETHTLRMRSFCLYSTWLQLQQTTSAFQHHVKPYDDGNSHLLTTHCMHITHSTIATTEHQDTLNRLQHSRRTRPSPWITARLRRVPSNTHQHYHHLHQTSSIHISSTHKPTSNHWSTVELHNDQTHATMNPTSSTTTSHTNTKTRQ